MLRVCRRIRPARPMFPCPIHAQRSRHWPCPLFLPRSLSCPSRCHLLILRSAQPQPLHHYPQPLSLFLSIILILVPAQPAHTRPLLSPEPLLAQLHAIPPQFPLPAPLISILHLAPAPLLSSSHAPLCPIIWTLLPTAPLPPELLSPTPRPSTPSSVPASRRQSPHLHLVPTTPPQTCCLPMQQKGFLPPSAPPGPLTPSGPLSSRALMSPPAPPRPQRFVVKSWSNVSPEGSACF